MGVLTWEQAAAWRIEQHDQGRSVVFTNGVFDILHAGHVDYLTRARTLGNRLILGLNSDSSVRRIKGPKRPIVNEKNRAAVLLGLKAVDAVVMFDEDTPKELIDLLLPDILVKGGDYTPETVVGRSAVEENGGRVEIIPFVDGLSSTNVVETILERYCEK